MHAWLGQEKFRDNVNNFHKELGWLWALTFLQPWCWRFRSLRFLCQVAVSLIRRVTKEVQFLKMKVAHSSDTLGQYNPATQRKNSDDPDPRWGLTVSAVRHFLSLTVTENCGAAQSADSQPCCMLPWYRKLTCPLCWKKKLLIYF